MSLDDMIGALDPAAAIESKPAIAAEAEELIAKALLLAEITPHGLPAAIAREAVCRLGVFRLRWQWDLAALAELPIEQLAGIAALCREEPRP